MNFNNYIPKDKFDIAAIERANQIGFPALNPILPDLLEWLKDANWPVAVSTASLPSNAVSEIVPHIQHILKSKDSIWKYWTIELVLKNLRADAQDQLNDDLVQLVDKPTKEDRIEKADVAARGILFG